jgi:hypothetical protein
VEFNEITPELFELPGIQARHDGFRWAKSGDEQISRPLAAWHPQDRCISLEPKVERVPEQFPDSLGAAPGKRRWWSGGRRWWEIGLHHGKEPFDRAAWHPGKKADSAAFLTHSAQFPCGVLWTGGKHDTVGGEDAVKTFILERERLGVANVEFDFRCQRLRRFYHAAAQVDANHVGAIRRQAARRPPGAGCDIEKSFPRHRINPPHQMLDRISSMLTDLS